MAADRLGTELLPGVRLVVKHYLPPGTVIAVGEPSRLEQEEMRGMSREEAFVYLAARGRIVVATDVAAQIPRSDASAGRGDPGPPVTVEPRARDGATEQPASVVGGMEASNSEPSSSGPNTTK